MPISKFCVQLPKYIRNGTYDKLHLKLSHLRNHKFNNSFQVSINPLCRYGQEGKSTTHFFRYCPLLNNEGSIFLGALCRLE